MSIARPVRVAFLVVFAALSGCGMRSVLDSTGGGQAVQADAGATVLGGGGSTALGTPCGRGGTCDTRNLDSETCGTLGAGSGRLACDPQTCYFDLSLCTGVTTGRAGSGGSAGRTGGVTSTAGTGGFTLGGGGTGAGTNGGGTLGGGGTGAGTNGGGLFGGGTTGQGGTGTTARGGTTTGRTGRGGASGAPAAGGTGGAPAGGTGGAAAAGAGGAAAAGAGG